MTCELLQLRARVFASVRQFFAERQVLEVDTPSLARHAVTDPFIQSIQTAVHQGQQAQPAYLITSPEYYMKRLLAKGSSCIFQIGKAFRDDESGRYHQPEFTMLEWYRVRFDHHQLMAEVDELLQCVLQTSPAEKVSYRQLFQDYLQFDPHRITLAQLKNIAARQSQEFSSQITDTADKDTLLMLLLTHCIEPHLGQRRPIFIYDYPSTQAALARIAQSNPPVAQRFEVYYRGIELANGFHELTDAKEQAQRFARDNRQRHQLGLPIIEPDESLLIALNRGLPACAGVALGLDRLIMLASQADDLQQVMNFAWSS
jgi:elongation factor P--(R)-beta-lysine ligase